MDKIYYIPTDKKIVSLTFDDGPCNPTTLIILDILKQYNIKATFFLLIENVIKNLDITKKIIEDGHTIGLHAYNHISLRRFPKRSIYHQIKTTLNVLKDKFNINVNYFRPPYGTLTIDANLIAKELGLQPIGWTVMEEDWKSKFLRIKTTKILNKIIPGVIIVLHDGYRHLPHQGTTVEILKNILPVLLTQEFKFVSISELSHSKNIQPKIFNNIPLLSYNICNLMNKTVLFLYWDVNFTDPTKQFEIEIKPTNKELNNNLNFHSILNYPSPDAMEQWVQKIEFPLGVISKDSNILIKNNNQFLSIK